LGEGDVSDVAALADGGQGLCKMDNKINILNEDYMVSFVVLVVFKLLSQINGNSVNGGDLCNFIIPVRGSPCDCST
jgi:hypothetical protein